MTAFIDRPAATFDRVTAFWAAATGATPSPARGEHAEFATLIPPSGDAHLRVQRSADDNTGLHLDLHVASITEGARRARDLGAHLVAEPGHVVMTSPGGLRFCLVEHHGESTPAPAYPDQLPTRVDQICIDVPHDLFETEAAFWSAITGWSYRPGSLQEFGVLAQPPGAPFRILLQRLGHEDGGTTTRAHLDIACDDRVDEAVEWHRALGATLVKRFEHWALMTEPGGEPYCLTGRDPSTPR